MKDSETARRHLDKRFEKFQPLERYDKPQKGWIRAIREALGMTLEQLGSRLGVSKVRIKKIEESELNGSLSLNSLEKAAQAVGCRLVYFLVPEDSLQEAVEKQARLKAQAILSQTSHSMGLENQATSTEEYQVQLSRLTEKLLAGNLSKLWDD